MNELVKIQVASLESKSGDASESLSFTKSQSLLMFAKSPLKFSHNSEELISEPLLIVKPPNGKLQKY